MASYSVVSFKAAFLPAQYRNLIYSKWLRSLRYGNDYFRLIDANDFYKTYDKYIGLLFNNPDSVIRLAVLTDDVDVVLGFSLCRNSILDYVYVHKDHRKMGIGSRLVPAGIDTITHLTKIGLSIWGSKFSNWRFNPFV